MEKKSFIVHEKWLPIFLDAPDEDVGAIFKAMMRYTTTGDIGEVAPMHRAILNMMIETYTKDTEKYIEVCRKRKEAIEKRWSKHKQENTNEYKCIQENTNEYNSILNDTDKDKDKDKDKDMDMELDKVSEKNVLTDKERKEANASKREIIDALVAKWNSYADRGGIPTIRSVSVDSKTGKSVLARVKEHGLEEVVEVMDMVFRSNYLRGFKNGWCAKFDWIFLPTNYEKILNGNYNERDAVQTQNDMIDTWVADYHARKGEVV